MRRLLAVSFATVILLYACATRAPDPGTDAWRWEKYHAMNDNGTPYVPIPPHCYSCDPAQSWDQENLKRNDRGCPTAVYIAPKGELEQC